MPRKNPSKTPAYRERTGYNQAIVTLADSLTGRRRDYWLGEFNSPTSRERYHRLIAEWESSGRRWPAPLNEAAVVDAPPAAPAPATSPPPPIAPVNTAPAPAAPQSFDPLEPQLGTIEEIILAFLQWAEQNKRQLGGNIKGALRLLRQLYGSTPAASFGPKRLRVVREAMIRGDPTANPPRQPWTRSSINKQCKNIVKLFKWAASHELLPVAVYQTLQTVENLKAGQTTAAEAEPVRPITAAQVEAVRPHLSSPLLALIDLQLFSGARGGELFKLRKRDLDRSDPEVWVYRPDGHKTAHRGKKRAIYFGPRAQQILKPFLDRGDDEYLFSPREGALERLALRHERRKTPMSCGNKPGDVVTRNPTRPPGGHYNRNSYVRAVARACEAAFPPPPELARQRVRGKKGMRVETDVEWKTRLGKKWSLLKKWRKEHRWHPHQLRHTAATNIRRDFGLEAAQLALGHCSALITDAVYAERDMDKVMEVMRKAG